MSISNATLNQTHVTICRLLHYPSYVYVNNVHLGAERDRQQ